MSEGVVYECDGCQYQGTEPQVVAHIDSMSTYSSGQFKPLLEIKCWGYFVVGSEAWRQFHEDGIHPMTNISITAAAIAMANRDKKDV